MKNYLHDHYHLRYAGSGEVGEGDPPSGDWDASLTLTLDLLHSLLQGRMSPFDAYMRGELEVDGDLRAASRLGQLADLIKN